jgi:dihydrofolate reductase
MRRLVVSEFVTLDGVMEAPGGEPTHPHAGWALDHMGPEQMQYKLDEVLAAGSLLLGRITYEGFSAAWPGREGEFADKMNSMPKHVVSTTLRAPAWNNTTVLQGEVTASIPALKAGEGGPILVAGSRTLVHALLVAGLVDELRLMVFPVAVGQGLRVFPDDRVKLSWRLASDQRFATGVLALAYEPVS